MIVKNHDVTKKNTEEYPQMPELCVAIPDTALPDPDSISYYVMEKERKIYLECDVGPDMMSIQRLIMRWNREDAGKPESERMPIRIYIMSYGGDVDYMWLMIDTILSSSTPVWTVNIGMAGSAAGLIFMAGHKRFMFPDAKVVIHEGSASMSGDAVKVIDATDSYRKELRKMKDFILAHTKIPKSQLNKKRNNDWTLDSAYCMDNSVCDEIITSLDAVL